MNNNTMDGVVQAQHSPQNVFLNAFGGGTASGNPPMIHSKLLALRKEIGHIAAKRAPGVPFPVKGAKDLAQKMAEALRDLNLLAPVVHQDVTLMETPVELVGANKSGGPRFATLAHVKATVRIIAEDGSFLDMVGSGHGADGDDKAGGKASTYAWKDAILKGLTIPDAEMADTDDDSGDSYEKGPKMVRDNVTKNYVPAESKVERAKQEFAEGSKVIQMSEAKAEVRGLDYLLSQIDKAQTKEDIDLIGKAIKEGDIVVTGMDKLKASAAFVAKRDAIRKGTTTDGPGAA